MKQKYRHMASFSHFSFHFWQAKPWKKINFQIFEIRFPFLVKFHLLKKGCPWCLEFPSGDHFHNSHWFRDYVNHFGIKTPYNLFGHQPFIRLQGIICAKKNSPIRGSSPLPIGWPSLVLEHPNISDKKFSSKWIWCENTV
jgi:hypothetical protein